MPKILFSPRVIFIISTKLEKNNEIKMNCSQSKERAGQKKLNKTFSYNSGCLAVIIWLLFNPHNAVTVTLKKKICYCCVLQYDSTERIKYKFCTSSSRHKVSKVTNLVGLAQPSTWFYSKESREKWRLYEWAQKQQKKPMKAYLYNNELKRTSKDNKWH